MILLLLEVCGNIIVHRSTMIARVFLKYMYRYLHDIIFALLTYGGRCLWYITLSSSRTCLGSEEPRRTRHRKVMSL